MSKNDDFTQQAVKRYAELEKQEEDLRKRLAEIQAKKKPLKAYLYETGDLERPTRAKRKKQPPNKLEAVS